MSLIVVLLCFFAPMAVIYGRRRAYVISTRTGRLSQKLLRLLVVPAVVAVSMPIAVFEFVQGYAAGSRAEANFVTGADIAGGDAIAASDHGGVAELVISILAWIGVSSIVLFFVAIPYVLGSVYAAALLILNGLGRIRIEPPQEQTVEPVS
ncbi:hypothetical protein [Jiella avicenniae]|uniref:Uncharacterized protein n=1 Tax=Jiella avicenniae TaxID=2907202 RepID=A0A9X1P0S0_9HYPH|nr:hypothetical protein [Jiella avicenniae]MCE7029295.1 hypothetical protein [Jiella avicenniae]